MGGWKVCCHWWCRFSLSTSLALSCIFSLPPPLFFSPVITLHSVLLLDNLDTSQFRWLLFHSLFFAMGDFSSIRLSLSLSLSLSFSLTVHTLHTMNTWLVTGHKWTVSYFLFHFDLEMFLFPLYPRKNISPVCCCTSLFWASAHTETVKSKIGQSAKEERRINLTKCGGRCFWLSIWRE